MGLVGGDAGLFADFRAAPGARLAGRILGQPDAQEAVLVDRGHGVVLNGDRQQDLSTERAIMHLSLVIADRLVGVGICVVLTPARDYQGILIERDIQRVLAHAGYLDLDENAAGRLVDIHWRAPDDARLEQPIVLALAEQVLAQFAVVTLQALRWVAKGIHDRDIAESHGCLPQLWRTSQRTLYAM